MIDELRKLVHDHHAARGTRISLARPLPMADTAIILPPLQMTRFPFLAYVSLPSQHYFSNRANCSDFRICPLAPNLAPVIVPGGEAPVDVFIYSPFQVITELTVDAASVTYSYESRD